MNAVLFAIICAAFLKYSSPVKTKRIVGGDVANIKDYPYQLSIIHKADWKPSGRLLGGAVIVSPFWALTSAHLITNHVLLQPQQYFVRGNSSHWKKEKGITVEHLIIIVRKHPNYSGRSHDYSTALLKVQEPFNGCNEKSIRVAGPLYPVNTYTKVAVVTATGWGLTKRGQDKWQSYNILRIVYASLLDSSYCRRHLTQAKRPEVNDRLLCVGDSAENFCHGDEGGGLAHQGVLIGIAISSNECGYHDQPGIFTRLASMYSWFHEFKADDTHLNMKFTD